MSDFTFLSPGGFATEFQVAARAGYVPTDAEGGFIACLNGCVGAIDGQRLRQRDATDAELLAVWTVVRDNAVKRLRGVADTLAALAPGIARDAAARDSMAECWRIEGQFREYLRRLDTVPFTVVKEPNAEDPKLTGEIRIVVRDSPITVAAGLLKAELDSAVTLTKAVLTERERAAVGAEWWMGRREPVLEARRRLSEYMTQLHGIATVGLTNLDPTQAVFARVDLQRYRAEFLVREAGAVKNRYVWRLGVWCLLVAVVSVAAYAVVRNNAQWGLLHVFRNFFLLSCGTAVGTWLSFSLRRVVLTFDDLAVLEEDRLDPGLRVLFMVALVSVVGLLFSTGAVSFGIGPVTSQAAMLVHGSSALLVGLLAGIAERALGTAVSRRAADFAGSVGGTVGAAAVTGKP